MSEPLKLTLDVLRNGEERSVSFTVGEGQSVIVGRGECELVLDDRTVSRKHLRLVGRGGRLVAKDLGSTSGTLHNGMPLERAQVRRGDAFVIGPFVLRVAELSDKGPADAVAAPKAGTHTFKLPLVGSGGILPLGLARNLLSLLRRPAWVAMGAVVLGAVAWTTLRSGPPEAPRRGIASVPESVEVREGATGP